jgi:hypothetical protein
MMVMIFARMLSLVPIYDLLRGLSTLTHTRATKISYLSLLMGSEMFRCLRKLENNVGRLSIGHTSCELMFLNLSSMLFLAVSF